MLSPRSFRTVGKIVAQPIGQKELKGYVVQKSGAKVRRFPPTAASGRGLLRPQYVEFLPFPGTLWEGRNCPLRHSRLGIPGEPGVDNGDTLYSLRIARSRPVDLHANP